MLSGFEAVLFGEHVSFGGIRFVSFRVASRPSREDFEPHVFQNCRAFPGEADGMDYSQSLVARVFTCGHNLFLVLSKDGREMRFPYPLDDCACGHYRITHDTPTSLKETRCNACTCTRFSLRNSEDERSEVRNQA